MGVVMWHRLWAATACVTAAVGAGCRHLTEGRSVVHDSEAGDAGAGAFTALLRM